MGSSSAACRRYVVRLLSSHRWNSGISFSEDVAWNSGKAVTLVKAIKTTPDPVHGGFINTPTQWEYFLTTEKYCWKNSLYRKLCESLDLRNTVKNRKWVYLTWKRLLSEVSRNKEDSTSSLVKISKGRRIVCDDQDELNHVDSSKSNVSPSKEALNSKGFNFQIREGGQVVADKDDSDHVHSEESHGISPSSDDEDVAVNRKSMRISHRFLTDVGFSCKFEEHILDMSEESSAEDNRDVPTEETSDNYRDVPTKRASDDNRDEPTERTSDDNRGVPTKRASDDNRDEPTERTSDDNRGVPTENTSDSNRDVPTERTSDNNLDVATEQTHDGNLDSTVQTCGRGHEAEDVFCESMEGHDIAHGAEKGEEGLDLHSPCTKEPVGEIAMSGESDDDYNGVVFDIQRRGVTKTQNILPLGSKNVWNRSVKLPPRPMKWKGRCNIFEGEFEMSSEQWGKCEVNGKVTSGTWNYILSQKLKEVNNVCVIHFKQNTVRNMRTIFYGYCAHTYCKLFIITVYKTCSPIRAVVMSSSVDFCHSEKTMTRQARGVARKMLQLRLRPSNALLVRSDDVKNASDVLGEESDGVHQLGVYHKAKSEDAARYDRHVDDVVDVLLRRRESAYGTPYIIAVGEPFFVHLCTPNQIALAKSVYDRYKHSDLHIDATGQVVRRPQCVTKVVYYYAATIAPPGSSTIVPVADMVTCNHDANSIGSWLRNVEQFAKKLNKWPLFTRVVTDFSLATINAVLREWNGVDLPVYLNYCFVKIVVGESLVNCGMSVIMKLCSMHLMKNIASDINEHVSDQGCRTFLKESMASLFDDHSIMLVSSWFVSLVRILSCRCRCSVVSAALLEMKTIGTSHESSGCDADLIRTALDRQLVHNRDPFSSKQQPLKSTWFFQYFDQLRTLVLSGLSVSSISSAGVNTFYNPHLVNVLIEKYLLYYPMWVGSKTSPNPLLFKEKCDNSVAEHWFLDVKKGVLQYAVNLKCGRFLRTLRDYEASVVTMYRRYESKQKKFRESNNTSSKEQVQEKKEEVPSLDDTKITNKEQVEEKEKVPSLKDTNNSECPQPEPEETWRKKNRRAFSYSQMRYTRKTDFTEVSPLPCRRNGLVNSTSYYLDAARKVHSVAATVLCTYRDRNLKGYCSKEVRFTDIKCLQLRGAGFGDLWINNDIIDISLSVLIDDKPDVQSLLCSDGTYIFTKDDGNQIDLRGRCTLTGTLVMPVNLGGVHWSLCVADMNTKCFTFIDPMGGETLKRIEVFMNKFLNFVKHDNRRTGSKDPLAPTRGWKAVVRKHPCQRDSHNCGVYVIMFAKAIIEGNRHFPDTYNIDQARTEILDRLLEEADDVRNTCSLCGDFNCDDELTVEWVQCDYCTRYIHIPCIQKLKKVDKFVPPIGHYKCDICMKVIV